MLAIYGQPTPGRPREAIAVLEKASKAAPFDRDVLEALAVYYGEIGEDDRADGPQNGYAPLERGTPQ